MSNQYGKCAVCGKEILISCTNADYCPPQKDDQDICQDCFADELNTYGLREGSQ
jgi:hypothetical protein